MNNIRISGIIEDSIVDGPGLRFVVFTQGCKHNCYECHNKDTHDLNGGRLERISEICEKFQKNKLSQGLTISGGEPFLQPDKCYELAKFAHNINKNVIVYTGFLFEYLLNSKNENIQKFLNEIDILIDGKFEKDKKDYTLKFIGSSNQRIIDCKKSIKTQKIVEISI